MTFLAINIQTQILKRQNSRKFWIKTAGGSSISTDQQKNLKKKNKKFWINCRRRTWSVPLFKKNPGLKIALLNIDIDFVEPTLCVLENFYDNVSKGELFYLIITQEEDLQVNIYMETQAVLKFLKNKNLIIKDFLLLLTVLLN